LTALFVDNIGKIRFQARFATISSFSEYFGDDDEEILEVILSISKSKPFSIVF
jgi:hypothetical protein